MSKKEKTAGALAKDFQAMIAMVPKLTAFIKVHEEIAAAYQKYRKSGGAAIPGIEKHVAVKVEKSAPPAKKKVVVKPAKTKAPKATAPAPKAAKKVKK